MRPVGKLAIVAIVVVLLVLLGLTRDSWGTMLIALPLGIIAVVIGAISLASGSSEEGDEKLRFAMMMGGIGAIMFGHVGLVEGGDGGIGFGVVATLLGVMLIMVGIRVIGYTPDDSVMPLGDSPVNGE